ncbi:MAG: Ig-like domain-containing protein [Tannerella sp.]|jgi:hypothetical protein|nr:Ig-like domain-containing protein [Tannerella sp.]
MKRITFILTGLLLACTLTLTTTCNKPEEDGQPDSGTQTPGNPDNPQENPDDPDDPDDPQGNPDDPDNPPQYMYIDKDSELGESLGEWDAAILGKDGTDYFYQFRETLPEKFVIWDRSNETLAALLQFDEEGLPDAVLLGEYVFQFSNYRQNLCGITVIWNGDVIFELDSIESNLDWDGYRAENALPKLRSSGSAVKLKGMIAAVSSAGCVLSIAVAASASIATEGVLTVPAAALVFLSCGSAIISISDAACDCIPSWATAGSSIIGIVTGNPVEEGIMQAAGEATQIIDNIKESNKAKILASLQASAREEKVETKTADLILTLDCFYSNSWKYIKNELFEVGFCAGTDPEPTLENKTDAKVMDRDYFKQLQSSRFAVQRFSLYELEPSTTYYYRSFIAHYGVYSYGEVKSFKTKSPSLVLSSPEQGTEVKSGKPVDVTFHCFDPGTGDRNKPLTGITVHFESGDGPVNYSSRQTDGSGNVTVSWTPDKSGASLTAKILDSQKNVVTECTFTAKMNDFDIVGEWVCYIYDHFSHELSDINKLTFYPDGTFKLQFPAEAGLNTEDFRAITYPHESYTGTYEIIDDYIDLHILTAQCVITCIGIDEECASNLEYDPEMFTERILWVHEQIGSIYRLEIRNNYSLIYDPGRGAFGSYEKVGTGSATKSGIASIPGGSADAARYIVTGKDGKVIAVPEE